MVLPGFTAEASLPDLGADYPRCVTPPEAQHADVHLAAAGGRPFGVNPAIHYACHLKCDDFVCTVVCAPIFAPPSD